MDLYATDPDELEKLWKWQSRHLNGPTVPRADQPSPGWIPDHQKRQLEITDKICRAMDKPTLTEACKTWFAVTGRRRDGSEPFTGRLDVTPREILVAMADKEARAELFYEQKFAIGAPR